jgi:hypothetical protein
MYSEGRRLFSRDDPIDSLHNDRESLIVFLKPLESHHELLHCSYENDRATFSAALSRRWLRCYSHLVLGRSSRISLFCTPCLA